MKKITLLLFLCATSFVTSAAAQEVYDPIEPVNRGIFWFNDQFDTYLFKPVATAYDYVTPSPVQHSVGMFFDNLKSPIYLVSDLMQFKFVQATEHTARFLINSTVGFAGLFDPAAALGIEPHYEDIGTALGYYGVGPGPYLVLPILGPSNLRDTISFGAEVFLDPVFYVDQTNLHSDTAFAISAGAVGLEGINKRADLLETIQSAKDASLDYYLFTQSAYYQIRANQIYDNNPPSMNELDDEFEDEFEDFEDDLVEYEE